MSKKVLVMLLSKERKSESRHDGPGQKFFSLWPHGAISFLECSAPFALPISRYRQGKAPERCLGWTNELLGSAIASKPS